MEVSISIKDLDEVKEIIASLEECVNTLSRIAAWDELSLEHRVDFWLQRTTRLLQTNCT